MVETREATAADAEDIREVHLNAFPTAMEADLVERLNRDGDIAISLVAVEDDRPVGHIVFSRMTADADGRQLSALGLAPVAVLPQRQGEGIGSALVKAGLSLARSLGTDIVFVLGDPAYYRRFGFNAAAAAAFRSPYSGPYFQALQVRGSPTCGRGLSEYASAFAELQ
jgi:putative acetyltransferase